MTGKTRQPANPSPSQGVNIDSDSSSFSLSSSAPSSSPPGVPPARSFSSPSSSLDLSTSLSVEAANLHAQQLFESIRKTARGSLEALEAILLNPSIFLHCSSKEAKVLWKCTGISGSLSQFTRQECLGLMESKTRNQRMANSSTPLISSIPSAAESSLNDQDSDDDNLASADASTSASSQPSSTVMDATESGRHSSRRRTQTHQQKRQYEDMMRRLHSGVVLSAEERAKLSVENLLLYDEALRAQQLALSNLQRSRKRNSSSHPPLTAPTAPLSNVPHPSVTPATSTSSSSLGIPTINFDLPSSSHSHPRHRRSGAHKETVRTGQDNPVSAAHSDSSTSEDSSSDSSDSDSSSSDSSSDSSYSDSSSESLSGSNDLSSHGNSRRRRRSRRHKVRHRHGGSSKSLPSSLRSSRGLRTFLVQMGVTLNKARVLPEIERSMNGQSPIQWWRNAFRAATNQDSRVFHEGLNLALCLEAGKNLDYTKEIIARRLLGLQMVLSASERNKTEMWNKASAILPLTSMTSVSLPIQLMIDKETRRSSRSTSSSVSSTSTDGRNWRRRDVRRGPYPSGGTGGYNIQGGQRSSKRPKNTRSGAPSASSNQGSSAGGSGAGVQ